MTRRRNASRGPCRLCGKVVGRTGFAHVSHMRKHVRNSEATEHYKFDALIGYGHYTYRPTAKGKALQGPALTKPQARMKALEAVLFGRTKT